MRDDKASQTTPQNEAATRLYCSLSVKLLAKLMLLSEEPSLLDRGFFAVRDVRVATPCVVVLEVPVAAATSAVLEHRLWLI